MTTAKAAGFSLKPLVRQLRGRPDSEHEMSLNRLVFALVALTATLLLDLHPAGITVLIGFCALSLFVLVNLLVDDRAGAERRALMIVVDLATILYFMHLNGGYSAGFWPLLLWTILGNGFRFGTRYLFAATGVALVGFLAVIVATPFWREHVPLAAGLWLGTLAIPTYAATLIRKLSKATAAAEEASRAKSYFLASVSHELRTPLTAIIGLGAHLHEVEPDQERRAMAGTIVSAGRSLLRMINRLLDYSRYEAISLEVVNEPFDLNRLLTAVRELMQFEAQEKGLAINLHVADDTPVALVGDEGRLREILVNLIGNALKFTQTGAITISADRARDARGAPLLRLAVTDTGIGIAEEAQSHIFGSFAQADDTIMDRFGGTGLGLAICKQLAELMGGGIGVESRLGEGSSFWFTARVDEAEMLPSEATRLPMLAGDLGREGAEVAPKPRRQGFRILVADDNDVNQKVFGMILSRAGHEVARADDGDAALDLMKDHSFDIVLMDVNMPLLNGIEATKLYRFAALGQKRVPIVGITADASPATADRCLEAGMDACVAKPVDAEPLLDLIEQLATADAASLAALPTFDPTGVVTPLFRDATPISEPVIDRHSLAELEELGGRAFVTELLAIYLQDSADLLAAVAASVASGDVAAFRANTHALRSSAANVGALRVTALCGHYQRVSEAEFDRAGTRYRDVLKAELARAADALAAYADDRERAAG